MSLPEKHIAVVIRAVDYNGLSDRECSWFCGMDADLWLAEFPSLWLSSTSVEHVAFSDGRFTESHCAFLGAFLASITTAKALLPTGNPPADRRAHQVDVRESLKTLVVLNSEIMNIWQDIFTKQGTPQEIAQIFDSPDEMLLAGFIPAEVERI